MKRGIALVISAIILSAIVMAVGGAVWFHSQGAMTIIAEDYAEGVIKMTETITERFIIEHVSYNHDTDILRIWIYNYGDVDIEVNVAYPENQLGWKEVSSKGLEKIEIGVELVHETELGINVESRRGNDAYYMYVVP